MHNSQVPNRGKVAKWLDDFITSISGYKDEVSDTIKTADINVFDLPKIVWNDETFYVLFDGEKGTAKLYNRFSNEVQTLENVRTIEEVDKLLNSKQVVVTSEFDTELQKVVEADNIVNPDPNATMTNTTPEQVQPVPTLENPVPEQPQDPNQLQDPNQQVTASAIDEDIEKVGSALDHIARIAVLEEQVNTLVNVVEELKGQLYAYQNPGAIYDNNSAVEEQKHIEETSQETAKQISQDNSVDITTMEGRVSLVDRLRGELQPIIDMVEEVPESEEVVDINVEVEEPTETEIETEDITPETTDEIEVSEEPTTEEVVPEVVEEEIPEVTEEEIIDETEDDNEVEIKEEDIIKLNARDSKIFKKAICPHCGEDKLAKVVSVGSFIGIYCSDCSSEYAVDTDTEEIFKKN